MWRIIRLMRDRTAEAVLRDQILRREQGQGNINFPCSADNEQAGNRLIYTQLYKEWDGYTYMTCSTYITLHATVWRLMQVYSITTAGFSPVLNSCDPMLLHHRGRTRLKTTKRICICVTRTPASAEVVSSILTKVGFVFFLS